MEKTINATDKQIGFMRKLGYGNELHLEKITKQEARIWIEEKLKEDEKDNIEREPVKVGQDITEEEEKAKRIYKKYGVTTHVEKPIETLKPKTNGYESEEFQIKSRQCRSNALTCAIEWMPLKDSDNLLEQAKIFEKYIRFGE